MRLVMLFFALGLLAACGSETGDYERLPEDQLTWIDIETAAAISNSEERMYLIDIYTEWCGWCKVMDEKTFTDPTVIKFMNENFHVVKFDAEQKEPILFEGKTYEWAPRGRNGVNGLAVEMLGGAMSYPSYVYLDKDRKVVRVTKGFKEAPAFLEEMKSAVGG